MSHYLTNLRDIEFNLFEANRIQDYLGKEPFVSIDVDSAGDILREVNRLAMEELAASFVEADREEPRLIDGEVRLPAAVHASLDAYFAGGWDRIGLSERLGGCGAPPSLRWAAQELLVGANPAVIFYVGGPLMAYVLDRVGTEEQRENWAKRMLDRRWGATMVLTEADAGSDVGAATTRARHVEGDTYHIEGAKRFVTGGDNDYFENIVHLILARPEGAGPGTKGLSMFIVPKYLVNTDGSIGERNGVVVTRLEEKMGIRGSATCEMAFGLQGPCEGYLVGGVHEGIRQMFLVIEDARLTIGSKSAATLSTAYLNALAYARDRIQGSDITQTRDPDAARVPIIKHPDVRRMLMMQKAHAEGMRALVLYTAWVLDQAELNPDDEYWGKLAALLRPVVKGYCPERAYEVLGQSLQVLGGSGFTQDYPLEQYIRDVKIDSIYEGTTGMQGLDLFFRKIARDQGATLSRFAEALMETVEGGGEHDAFARERELLGAAVEDTQNQIGAMVVEAVASMEEPEQLYKVALHTNSLLEGLAEVIVGWLLLRHAEIAQGALDTATDRGFYEGKIVSARWFAANVLPKAAIRRSLAETEQGELMALDDAAF
jgi:alkylation response protein AidB-like acyl-CoA dehydrogenase